MEKWIVGIFLLICSVSDLRTKQVSVPIITIFAAAGIIFQLICGSLDFWQWMTGCLMGIGIVGIGWITREAIGYGDGLSAAVLGIWLGIFTAIEILFLGLLLSAGVSAVLITVKKAGRKYRIPFLPFILLGWGLWILTEMKEVL